jgi:hypothetical protein
MIRRIKPDFYLSKFVDFCKHRYGNKIIAIGIYGSYVWGYFDKEKSDYDVFLIFNEELENEGEKIMKQFKRITVQYFCSSKGLLNLIKEGHWSLYITLLKSVRMLYFSNEYKTLIKQIRKINFIDNLKNIDRIKWKAGFDKEVIEKSKGYDGAKYALPALRSKIQLLTYIKYKKLIWDLLKIIKLNRDILTPEESSYLIQLDKSVKLRKDIFPDKEIAVKILNKVSSKILELLS